MVTWFKKPFVTVVIPGADRLFFGDTDGKKYRKYVWVSREEPLAAAFQKAREEGMGPAMALLAAFPAVQMESLRYPEMTEEDLRETMDWESDRIFRTSQELVTDYRVTRHSPEGYEVLAAACPAAVLRPWQEAAEEAGCRLAWILPPPVPDASLAVTGLWGCDEVRMYGWEAGRIVRKLRAGRGDTAAVRAFLAGGPEAADVRWWPSDDCGEDIWEALRHLFPEGQEETVWQEAIVSLGYLLAHARDGINLAAEKDRETAFWSPAVRRLRLLQGVCLVMTLFALFLGSQYMGAREALLDEEARSKTLAPAREAWQADRAEMEKRAAQLAEGKACYGKNSRNEARWIALADVLPPGIVLKSVDMGDKEAAVTGTADRSGSVMLLQKRLSAAWNMNCRIEDTRDDRGLPLRRFVLRGTEKEPPDGQ